MRGDGKRKVENTHMKNSSLPWTAPQSGKKIPKSLHKHSPHWPVCASFFFFFKFLAALGLHCCARAFSSCGEWGLLFVAVCGLLIAVASLIVEHRL